MPEPHKAINGSELLVSALPSSMLGFSVGAQHGPSGPVSGNLQVTACGSTSLKQPVCKRTEENWRMIQGALFETNYSSLNCS